MNYGRKVFLETSKAIGDEYDDVYHFSAFSSDIAERYPLVILKNGAKAREVITYQLPPWNTSFLCPLDKKPKATSLYRRRKSHRTAKYSGYYDFKRL